MTARTLHQVQRTLQNWDPISDPIIMEPEAAAPNYWVGCASALAMDERILLTFRRRRPRGTAAERGWQIGIAELNLDLDPSSLQEIVTIHKDELGTSSMERSCLVPSADSGFELYISYVDPADDRWRVDVVPARELSAIDVTERREVFTAGSIGEEGVKDPRVVHTPNGEYMILSVARARVDAGVGNHAHATQDIYNTDQAISLTALARRGEDGGWKYTGAVLTPPAEGWDSNVTRVGSVLPVANGYVGFYDGESSWERNYEELAGLAFSPDLHRWERLSTEGPYRRSGGATDSIRYVDAVDINGRTHLFYELTRPDGAHDLRVHRLEE